MRPTYDRVAPPRREAEIVFPPAGEMGRLCRETDWAATPLGPVEEWPQSLRTAAGMVVAQGIAQSLYWGPELIQIYNGYRAIMGDKHPAGLGRSVLRNWSEIRDEIAPLFERVLQGETVYFEDLHLRVERHGSLEDAYFTFSYSPVRVESGEIIPPLALDGPHMSIRKFKRDAMGGEDLLRTESITPAMLELLEGIVKARLNILISGGTGAGKTTLLNILSSFIPAYERILTIEDSAELQLRQPHVVRLETRPANIEGQGEVPQRMLLVNSLRMRPDRIVMGEVRGSEAVDMLQAMNTGHDGSLTTLHANTPRDALSRLETMISMANLNLPERAMRQQIASAIDVVIQASRLSDGTRKVMSISEIVGMEGEIITMQEIFMFEREGMDETGKVIGRFRPTGIRPKFADRLKSYGIDLPATLFSPTSFAAAAGGDRW